MHNNYDLISFESEIEESINSLDRIFKKSKITFKSKGLSAVIMCKTYETTTKEERDHLDFCVDRLIIRLEEKYLAKIEIKYD